ncbi:L-gulonolactone oxidase [Rhynchospora pubera]|uniref:L-gulonolactone oxidase n=1 Tax=Rhynchospora pubera TaxID=906938 RepID=A0AAV8GG30_9POAL|nr:L-gulonolactone oxidase [Rhynchospora pubera]
MENSTLTKSSILLLTAAILLLFLFPDLSTPSPPPSPVNCTNGITNNCTVTNAYGMFPDRSTCHALKVVYPTSEQELLQFVANATASKTKMKVVTRFSHSIPKLSCPESGVTVKALIEATAEANLVIPYVPYWFGLTIGGLLSTGAHGSSLNGKGSAVHEYVTEMRLVTPAPADQNYATVKALKIGDPDLDATKVSLGVLGVISQVTLQLQPMFKRSLTFVTRNDSDLADQAVSFGYQHEFADLAWYPGQRKVLYRKDDRVPVNVSGNGAYDFIGFRPTATFAIQTYRFTEKIFETENDADGKCVYSQLITSTLAILAYGLTNNGLIFTGYPVIGYQNKMEAAGGCAFRSKDGLLTACPWDPRIKGSSFFHQTTVSIPLDRVKEFILDLQKLRDLQPAALCGLELYGGVLMRYAKSSSAYLGKEADVLDFDFTYYRQVED